MRLAERLTNIFSQEGIISDEEREIVRFGLESLGGNFVGVVLTLLVGICFKRVGDALLLYLLLFPLRKSAGGFHATTKVRCFITSAVMLDISFILFSAFDHAFVFYWVCAIMFGCIIWILAPVDNPSKRFDIVEQSVYRMRSRVVFGVESIIFVIASCLKWGTVIRSVCMAFFIASVSLLMGILKNVLVSKGKSQMMEM